MKPEKLFDLNASIGGDVLTLLMTLKTWSNTVVAASYYGNDFLHQKPGS